MTDVKELVKEIHPPLGLPINTEPSMLTVEEQWKYQAAGTLDFVVHSVVDAIVKGDLEKTASELAFLVYSAHSAALIFGVDLDPMIVEVHKAAMANALVYESGGDVMENFQKPDVYRVMWEGVNGD